MGYGDAAWSELVRQIRLDPSDDDLRYVAADYLIERDDPRGEFILLARRLGRGTVPPSQYLAAYERHRELQKEAPWEAQLRAILGRDLGIMRMVDGFYEAFYGPIANLPALCRLEPIVRLGAPHVVEADLACPELAQIVEFSIGSTSAPLLASPHLTGVRHIDVGLTPEICDLLARSVVRPWTCTLRGFDDGWRALVETPVFDELRELPQDLDEVIAAFPDDGLRALRVVRSDRITAIGLARLGARLDQLEVLSTMAAGAIAVIRQHVTGRNLRELGFALAATEIDAALELLDSPVVANVAQLTIRGIPLPSVVEHGLRRLAGRGGLRAVTVMSRHGDRIDIPGVDVIPVT